MIFVEKADHQKPNDVKFEVEEEEDPGRAFHCCAGLEIHLFWW